MAPILGELTKATVFTGLQLDFITKEGGETYSWNKNTCAGTFPKNRWGRVSKILLYKLLVCTDKKAKTTMCIFTQIHYSL